MNDMQKSGNMFLPDNNWLVTFPEIKAVNRQLLEREIPCLIVSVTKNRKGQVRELACCIG